MINTKTKKIFVGMAALLVLVIVGFWYYECVYTKTPQYTMKILQKAVINHDVNTVYQHIDIDKILYKSIDKYIQTEFVNSPQVKNSEYSEMAKALADIALPIMISKTKQDINDLITGNTVKKKSILAPIYDNKNSLSMEINQTKKISDDKAEIQITITNTKRYTSAPLILKLSRLPDKTWKIFDIDGIEKLSWL
ncbi:hypothetical protein [Megasphaera sp.]|uniref:hypothetical protein n=1 Tax=Megasphaera sp. TaxID=2023260 RepID=UPI003FEEA56E